jgi:methylenetetrahydrofolate dehydrogenase (NADP+)/methenyltetrahydrofolate cyclohydrolase
MLLDGRELVGYIQQRQARQVRSLAVRPRLAIVRQGATKATDTFLRVKTEYGEAIGVAVDTHTESPEGLLRRLHDLNEDETVTGIIVQLPLENPNLTDEAVAAVAPNKDVDGLGPNSPFDPATPKAIMWLLSGFNIELKGKQIAIVGQGRLVGKPLADQLEISGHRVSRIDETVDDLVAQLRGADIIITATGQPGLITSSMVKQGAVVIDAGAPKSDLAEELRARKDLKVTPNPGGVGPVTVAALFDNLVLAALGAQ